VRSGGRWGSSLRPGDRSAERPGGRRSSLRPGDRSVVRSGGRPVRTRRCVGSRRRLRQRVRHPPRGDQPWRHGRLTGRASGRCQRVLRGGTRPVRHGPDARCPAVTDGLPGLGRGDVGGRVADREHGIAGLGLGRHLPAVIARASGRAPIVRPGGIGPGRLPACGRLVTAGIRLAVPRCRAAGAAAVPGGELARRVHRRRLTGHRRVAADRAPPGGSLRGRAVPAARSGTVGRRRVVRSAALSRPPVRVGPRHRPAVTPAGEPGVGTVVGRDAHAAERICSARPSRARRRTFRSRLTLTVAG
jgi:hypothetical protein